MTRLTAQRFTECVTEANLAPSVHNVQPARWSWDGSDTITLSCDSSTALGVADPSGRDQRLSCGTALEGMVMALRKAGLEAEVQLSGTTGPNDPLAHLHLRPGKAAPDPLDPFVQTRFTCRSGFAPAAPDLIQSLQFWAKDQGDIYLITDPKRIADLATENDRLSLELFRQTAFRRELRQWMRLTRRHARWKYDGLNAQAMALSRAEALIVPAAISRIGFWLLDRIGLSKSLVSEAAKTTSASAILCLAAPVAQSPLLTGRRYYRMCLELARIGFSSWPASVLVDDPASQAALSRRFALDPDQRLISCLRLGPSAPPTHPRARRTKSEIILE